MSALLVDELYAPLSPRQGAEGWRHVERPQQARPHLAAVPVAEPGRPRPAAPTRQGAAGAAPLRLTDRGIAVILGFLLALVAAAAVVLVVGFLGVSNEPFQDGGQLPTLVTTLG